MSSFLKIDELTVADHTFLDLKNDSCWYMFNYTSNVGYSYSPTNNLISNLKKEVSKKGTTEYQYKENAIKEVAKYFSAIECKDVTFVPMPPSKIKGDVLYDDRIYRILTLAYAGNPSADIRELVTNINNTIPSHHSTTRLSIKELEDNLFVDMSLSVGLRKTIFLVDDVLTTGRHFIATKNAIIKTFPNIFVVGLFICRRAI